MKFIYTLILAFVVSMSMSNTAFSQTTTNTKQATDSLKTTRVKVKGITCANDLITISGNVEKIEGVSSFEPKKQGATSTFELKYSPATVPKKEIFATIEDTPGCEDINDRPYKVKQ